MPILFLITCTKLRNVLVWWPLRQGECLVPRLDDRFEEPVINVAILEGFQKLGYDRPTQEQAQVVRTFVLGSDVFVMLPTGSSKSLCYASLLYIFDSLQFSWKCMDCLQCVSRFLWVGRGSCRTVNIVTPTNTTDWSTERDSTLWTALVLGCNLLIIHTECFIGKR